MSKVHRASGAAKLREYIRRANLTQAAAAAEFDLSDAHLSEILSGKAFPSLAAAVRIESATGIPTSAFARVV